MARGDRTAIGEEAYRFLSDPAAQKAFDSMREELVRALEDLPLGLEQNNKQAIEVIRQLQTLRTMRRKVTAAANTQKQPDIQNQPQRVQDPRWRD